MDRPFVLGLAGGTGSGKTTVAEVLANALGVEALALLTMDSYYRDEAGLSLPERALLNYDHPDAFDWPLLQEHLDALTSGDAVAVPTYDFTEYRRRNETVTLTPARIVVVEGILALHHGTLRDAMDLKIFVDADADVRFIRRLQRDVADRGRSVDSVVDQYLSTVRPMHLQFVEPTKRFADVIVPHGGRNAPALDVLLARVRAHVSGRSPLS